MCIRDRHVGCQLLQCGPLTTITHEDEPDVRCLRCRESRGVDHILQALLEAHVAAMQRNYLVTAPPLPRSDGSPVGARPCHVRPIGDDVNECPRDAQPRNVPPETLVEHPY